jgi:hypothetical protein
MGVLVASGENGKKEMDKSTISLQVEVGRPVKANLRQLESWSLIDIRRLYEEFVSRKLPMVASRAEFCRLMPFSHKNSEFIFREYAGEGGLVFYEVLGVLTLCAYAHYVSKLHCVTC